MSDSKDDSSGIVQRLEELNQWQEEQKRILFERQNNQRKLLGLEHRKMYETLGIYHGDSSTLNDNDDASVDESTDSEIDLGVSALDQTVDEEVISDFHQEPEASTKRPFLRRKQGLINRFKVDPDQFRLSNLPPYKFSSTHPSLKKNYTKKPPDRSKKQKDARPISKAVLKLRASDKPKKKSANIDELEEKFQKSLISSQTACNSTPDLKSQSSSIKETPEPISWATILDPMNIKPIEKQSSSPSCLESKDNTDNLSIFELLEQQAKDGSFDLNSSYIQRFLKNKRAYSNDEQQVMSPVCLKLPPVPFEVHSSSKSLVSDSSETDEEEQEKQTSINPRLTARVRFSDDPTPLSEANLSETVENSDASQVFEEFKQRLFANQSDSNNTIENGQSSDMAQEMLQKAELIRTRLTELEAEINTFKKNNMELVKSKQEHELDKAHFEQECLEAAEKLNDERIQMEIYLHDERMKIEGDRKKMEKQIRHQKSLNSGKEKKEIAKLQEEIEALQKEMKKKDEAHIAAQSRLRTQVRNLEKDVRQLNVDIEMLTKENKRLEAENLKINRQNNNKMLQEINRNIAKLAPKGTSSPHVEETPSVRPPSISKHQSKSKVVTHRKSTELKRKPSLVKQQNTVLDTSEDDLSYVSSDEASYRKSNSKVTFAKSPTPPTEKSPKDKVDANKSPPIPGDASFKREIRNPDGSKDIWYPNGNLKKISPDGMIIRMLYFNKDIKETNINEGTVKYYYAETNTWHTTYLDGLEILEFPNGQTEHRYKDGKVEVHFPNNSIKVTNPSDDSKLEEWRFADGTNLIQMKNGDKILLMSNGQKEIHTAHSKRREYPDGTVKMLYPDGSQETRYSNGRVRLKDKDGNLVMDTEDVKY